MKNIIAIIFTILSLSVLGQQGGINHIKVKTNYLQVDSLNEITPVEMKVLIVDEYGNVGYTTNISGAVTSVNGQTGAVVLNLTDFDSSGATSGQVPVADGAGGISWGTVSGGSGSTDLDYIASPAEGVISSSTGLNATMPLVNSTNAGLMSPSDFDKLTNISSGGLTYDDFSASDGIGYNSTTGEFGLDIMSLTYAAPSLGDYIPIRDSSDGTIKRINIYTLNELIGGSGGTSLTPGVGFDIDSDVLNLDLNEFGFQTMTTDDYILFYDVGTGSERINTVSHLQSLIGGTNYTAGTLIDISGSTINLDLSEAVSGSPQLSDYFVFERSGIHYRNTLSSLQSLILGSGTNLWTENTGYIAYTSGNVAVGSSSTTRDLHVYGDVFAKEVKVQYDLPAPDYVFEPDYELMELDKLENYLEDNKHLPEIPSAKDIKENGIDVADMNMLLLKKVEELTLYILQQEKRIEKLEAANANY